MDDASPTSEMGERKVLEAGCRVGGGGEYNDGAGRGTGTDGGGGKKERIKLEDLTRFTMVKRIW
jgi:hypothetical protein